MVILSISAIWFHPITKEWVFRVISIPVSDVIELIRVSVESVSDSKSNKISLYEANITSDENVDESISFSFISNIIQNSSFLIT